MTENMLQHLSSIVIKNSIYRALSENQQIRKLFASESWVLSYIQIHKFVFEHFIRNNYLSDFHGAFSNLILLREFCFCSYQKEKSPVNEVVPLETVFSKAKLQSRRYFMFLYLTKNEELPDFFVII